LGSVVVLKAKGEIKTRGKPDSTCKKLVEVQRTPGPSSKVGERRGGKEEAEHRAKAPEVRHKRPRHNSKILQQEKVCGGFWGPRSGGIDTVHETCASGETRIRKT